MERQQKKFMSIKKNPMKSQGQFTGDYNKNVGANNDS